MEPRKIRTTSCVITGILNIAFGITDLVIAIIIKGKIHNIEERSYVHDEIEFQYLLLGIVFIILSIVAGCFGIYGGIDSRRKCQIVTYLILSIVLAIFTAFGVYYSSGQAYILGVVIDKADAAGHRLPEPISPLYAFFIVNSVVNALHCV